MIHHRPYKLMLKHLHGASSKGYPVYYDYHQELKKNSASKPIICRCRVVCVCAGVDTCGGGGWWVVEEEVVHFRVEGGACKEEEVVLCRVELPGGVWTEFVISFLFGLGRGGTPRSTIQHQRVVFIIYSRRYNELRVIR